MANAAEGIVVCKGSESGVKKFISIDEPEEFFGTRVYGWSADQRAYENWEYNNSGERELVNYYAEAEYSFRLFLPRALLELPTRFPDCAFKVVTELEFFLEDWFELDQLRKDDRIVNNPKVNDFTGKETVKGWLVFENGEVKEKVRFGERLGLVTKNTYSLEDVITKKKNLFLIP